MTSFLSRRGYGLLKSSFTETQLTDIRKELTVKPSVNSDFQVASSFPVFIESNKKLYLPRNYGLKKYGKPDIDNLSHGTSCPLLQHFNGTLLDEQKGVIEKYISAARDPLVMGGLLELPTGFGKTVCALYILSQLQKKAIIICHKSCLITQWEERIQQYLPQARVGKIVAKTVDIQDKDIVIASLQSLALKTYPEELFEDFGIVVVDECHRIGAEKFSQALPKVTSRVALGLSATLTRKDGLTKIIKWHLGDTVVKIKKRSNVSTVRIDCLRYYSSDPNYSTEHRMWNQKPNMVRMMTDVLGFRERNEVLIEKIRKEKLQEPGRVFLILSQRRNHLSFLKSEIDKLSLGTSGFYIGGMKQEELDKSAQADFIFATVSLAQEGLDIPRLNTLVLASSISNVTQAVGRILRGQGRQQIQPLVIDMIDDFSIFSSQARKRQAHYKKCGYEIFDGERNLSNDCEPECKEFTDLGFAFQDS